MATEGIKFYQYYHIVCIYESTFSSPGNKYEFKQTNKKLKASRTADTAQYFFRQQINKQLLGWMLSFTILQADASPLCLVFN